MVTKTVDLSTPLDNRRVANGTKLIANFDRLGARPTLSGEGAGSSGAYQSGDLAGKSVVVEGGKSRHFQIAPGNEEEEQLSFELLDLRASGDTLDLAIDELSWARSRIGALQNHFGHSVGFGENEIENIGSYESTLRDSDITFETSKLSQVQILANSSSAMLAQAFVNSQRALQLI